MLKILRGGNGQLLGLDTAGTLEVSDALPLPSGCLFPAAERADDRDREAHYRGREDAYEAAANAVPISRQQRDRRTNTRKRP